MIKRDRYKVLVVSLSDIDLLFPTFVVTDYDRINAIGDYMINQYPTSFMQIILDLVIPFVG